ncbi:MAG: hypothetical protein DRJ42_11590 [Deltaproteobacteria bacterium]|nr:MAG: hypothetical protein DRJ42_11590 [Deltaproteobacteria bacterium]
MDTPDTPSRPARPISPEDEISRLRKQLAAVQADHDRLAFILDSIPDHISYVARDLTYRVCNQRYEAEQGVNRDALVGKHVTEFVGEAGFDKLRPHVERALKGELVTYDNRMDYRYMKEQDVQVQYAPHRAEDGTVLGFSVYVRNITAQRRAEEMLRRQAQHDPLTDLPNRILFDDRLKQVIARANRAGKQFAVLFIDLDEFKQVNDALGHEAGDQVLRDVAQNLRQTIRRSDTLARIGGDEFVLLAEEFDHADQVKTLAEKMVEAISNLPSPALQAMKVGASIGIALYPDHGEDARTLLVRADEAMYEAKQHGKGRCFFHGTYPG